MSLRNDVLGVLWSGKGKAVSDDEAAMFRTLLAGLFPGRTILIGVEGDAISERALLDDTEVMPSLSLGDVVAEELNVSVPYGTVIAFVPVTVFSVAASAGLRGQVIGRIYAQIILDSLHRGSFPMHRELSVLFGLCDAALSAVARLEAGSGQICGAAFEHALATTLCASMAGGGRDSDRCVNVEELRVRYGASVEGEVTACFGGQIPLSFQSWLDALAPSQDRGGPQEGGATVPRLRASKI